MGNTTNSTDRRYLVPKVYLPGNPSSKRRSKEPEEQRDDDEDQGDRRNYGYPSALHALTFLTGDAIPEQESVSVRCPG
jgi:hypothetical protein